MYDQKTILIADDEEYNFDLLRTVIKAIGKPVILCAKTGKEAIELVREHPEIDLVLLDIQMPDVNGYKAYEEIRQLLPVVPIIAITAFVFAESKRKVLEAGFDMYVSKPISRNTIKIILNTYLT
jgi:CheY-like chemotaxis protein